MHRSPHPSTSLRFPFTLLPLTARGGFLVVLSVAVLVAGVSRADLAGLFWGSSFFLASLYAIVGSHITRLAISRGKGKPGFLEVSLPASVAAPGDEAAAHLSVTLPRALMPGFTARFRLPLRWHERSVDGVNCPLSPGENTSSIRFRPHARGGYTADKAIIEVRDVLGFTSSFIQVSVSESVKVLPAVSRGARPPRIREEGGDSTRYAARRRRSEELLEVRKYFPGDDMRKLNWKVFAHLNELFLRIGEETPPPQSRFLFILDSTANPRVPIRAAADYLDSVVEACASAMSVLLDRGTDLLFWWPGAVTCRSFTQESRTELMALMACIWWAEPGGNMELPVRAGMHVVVFSTPGSPSLGRIMRELGRLGWKVSLFLEDLESPDAGRKWSGVKDLLLIPEEDARRRRGGPGEKALRSFREAMAEDSARYAGSLVAGGRAEKGAVGNEA